MVMWLEYSYGCMCMVYHTVFLVREDPLLKIQKYRRPRTRAAMRKVAAAAVAALGGAAVYYYYRKKRKIVLPLVVHDKENKPIRIRRATPADRPAVASDIADKTGTGSGTGNDDFLLQEFDRMADDPNCTLLFAEDAETNQGLGMMAVMWSSETESYWQSLRVAQAARGRALAARLFDCAARLAVEQQGAGCVARWGVVSNNEIMTAWSARLGLSGPQFFRRYGGSASAEPPPALPSGCEIRSATEADIPSIQAFLATAPVARSDFGDQNFVHNGWASFSEAALRANIARAPSRGRPCIAPLLLTAEGGQRIRGFLAATPIVFGDTRFLMCRPEPRTVHCSARRPCTAPRAARAQRTTQATAPGVAQVPLRRRRPGGALPALPHAAPIIPWPHPSYHPLASPFPSSLAQALGLLYHTLPSVAHKEGCDSVGGYVPTLPWVLEIFDSSPVYKRMTATEQAEFHWHPAAYAAAPLA